MLNAIDLAGRRTIPLRNLPPATEAALAKEFSAVILSYDKGTVARAAKRSKDSVKLWKAGENNPSLWSTLNMAQELPAVRNWLLGMLGVTDDQDTTPEHMGKVVAEAMKIIALRAEGK